MRDDLYEGAGEEEEKKSEKGSKPKNQILN